MGRIDEADQQQTCEIGEGIKCHGKGGGKEVFFQFSLLQPKHRQSQQLYRDERQGQYRGLPQALHTGGQQQKATQEGGKPQGLAAFYRPKVIAADHQNGQEIAAVVAGQKEKEGSFIGAGGYIAGDHAAQHQGHCAQPLEAGGIGPKHPKECGDQQHRHQGGG